MIKFDPEEVARIKAFKDRWPDDRLRSMRREEAEDEILSEMPDIPGEALERMLAKCPTAREIEAARPAGPIVAVPMVAGGKSLFYQLATIFGYSTLAIGAVADVRPQTVAYGIARRMAKVPSHILTDFAIPRTKRNVKGLSRAQSTLIGIQHEHELRTLLNWVLSLDVNKMDLEWALREGRRVIMGTTELHLDDE